MTFKGWQKTSLIEYPGKIASVLFTGGCNFRCPFCYNARLVLEPSSLPDLDGQDVLDYLKENRTLYQAVAITGGEPTLQPQLAGFLEQVKALGLLAGLETNGSLPEVLRSLMARVPGRQGLVDFVGMDVKAPLRWEAYRKAAGLGEGDRELFEAVAASLALLQGWEGEYELRCTAVPDLHSERDLRELAQQLQGARRFVLQQFVPGQALDPQLRHSRTFPAETLYRLQKDFTPLFSSCELRGV